MTEIILLRIPDALSFAECEKFLSLVSEHRQKKIERFHFEKDKLLSLFAELLVRWQVMQKFHIPNREIQFDYGIHGKPFLLNAEYPFSLSHSGKYIAFASSPFPIGIDIESVQKADLQIAESHFSPEELRFIQNHEQPELAFYQIWTAKEAYLKMTGDGLTVSLNTFCTISGLKDYEIFHVLFPDYVTAICQHSSLLKQEPVFMDATSLMKFFNVKGANYDETQ